MRPNLLMIAILLAMILGLSSSALANSTDAAPTDAALSISDGAPASQPTPPDDIAGAAGKVKQAIDAAKTGKWWLFSSLVILVLMFLAKLIGSKMGWWAKLGRWRYVIVPVLSVAAALLASFQGGVSFEGAVAIATSGPVMAKLQELWEHGIMGKAHKGAQ